MKDDVIRRLPRRLTLLGNIPYHHERDPLEDKVFGVDVI